MFRCVAAIPNTGGNCLEHFYTDTAEGHASAEVFAQQYNREGWGVYDCVSPLREERRAKDTVAQIVGLHWDLDARQLKEGKQEIIDRVRAKLEPFGILSRLTDSGRGVHVYSIFNEPVEAGAVGAEKAYRLLRQMAEYLGADMAPTHFAALMRRTGTVNSKEGGGPCQTIVDTGARCELSDVEAYLDLMDGNNSLFSSRAEPETPPNAGPVETDARLAAMQFQGDGDRSIHLTQLHVTASLTGLGRPVEETVGRILAATQAAVANDPRCNEWNWDLERFDLVRMCYDLVNKAMKDNGEDLSHCLPDDLYDGWQNVLAKGERPVVAFNGHGPHIRGYPWQKPAESAASNGLHLVSSQGAPQESKEEPKYRFRLMSFSDMRPGVEQPYLVDELVPAKGIVLMWGPPKCYKSFVMLDLMLHVAKGWEYRDRYVQQGTVVYCAFEGAHGYKKRIEALRRHYDLMDDEEPVPLYVMPGQANLVNDHRRIVSDIHRPLWQTVATVVVLDTLNKSLHGSESKDVDMSSYIRAAEAIRDAFQCVVIIIHHCGLDESRPRGHSALPAAVDAQLAVTRQNDMATVLVELMRDGPEGAEIASKVLSIEVGMDANGRPLTSRWVMPADAPESTPAHRSGKWPPSLKVFHAALTDAILSHGVDHHIENGPTVRAADLERMREAFYRSYAV